MRVYSFIYRYMYMCPLASTKCFTLRAHSTCAFNCCDSQTNPFMCPTHNIQPTSVNIPSWWAPPRTTTRCHQRRRFIHSFIQLFFFFFFLLSYTFYRIIDSEDEPVAPHASGSSINRCVCGVAGSSFGIRAGFSSQDPAPINRHTASRTKYSGSYSVDLLKEAALKHLSHLKSLVWFGSFGLGWLGMGSVRFSWPGNSLLTRLHFDSFGYSNLSQKPPSIQPTAPTARTPLQKWKAMSLEAKPNTSFSNENCE